MIRLRIVLVAVAVAILCSVRAGALGAAQSPAAAPNTVAQSTVTLTDTEQEAFLLNASVVSTRPAGGGVTNSRRATLTNGTITHDAHIQVIDDARARFQANGIAELGFKDTYRYNIAGYRLARLLGMDNVPVSVARRVEGKMAAVTWWVDDVQMDEKERLQRKSDGPDPGRTDRQIHLMRVFDELIQNKDRNQGNVLWTGDWKMWLIDHTRAFRLDRQLLKPTLLTRAERTMLQRLRELTPDSLRQTMEGVLTSGEWNAILARRDRILKHFDERMAKAGEAAVLFSNDGP